MVALAQIVSFLISRAGETQTRRGGEIVKPSKKREAHAL